MTKDKIIAAYSFIALLILFTTASFGQKSNQPKIKTKAHFSKPKADTTKEHIRYTALVYFSGNGLSQVKAATFYSSDLSNLMKMIDSTSNGAIVSFDYLKSINEVGKTKTISKIPYNFNKSNDSARYESKAVKEVKKLMALDFVSGTIYFSGENFVNVILTKPKGVNSLKTYYDRCGPGSIITLDNCVYKKFDGTLSKPITQSLKLE
jgi:hypothetical protein